MTLILVDVLETLVGGPWGGLGNCDESLPIVLSALCSGLGRCQASSSYIKPSSFSAETSVT